MMIQRAKEGPKEYSPGKALGNCKILPFILPDLFAVAHLVTTLNTMGENGTLYYVD
ncbi:hypothetical protein FHW11_000448 [Pantoea agglomerans]|nr:hypothetical protein [Pantoea agglomerans]MBA8890353.1 hypothetical protein [Pantoea agglomerans]